MDLLASLKIFLRNQQALRSLSKDNLKIHFGSGNIKLPGWLNTDLFDRDENLKIKPDMYLNITQKLPFKNNVASFLYNEHLVEHIEVEKITLFFKEAYRILKKGGVLRLATPDLEHLAKKYLSKSWKKQDWLSWPEYRFIKTKAEMLNIAMRWWEHKYLYDEEELKRRLRESGFKKIKRVDWRKSQYPDLRNLETRKDSKLIMEVVK